MLPAGTCTATQARKRQDATQPKERAKPFSGGSRRALFAAVEHNLAPRAPQQLAALVVSTGTEGALERAAFHLAPKVHAASERKGNNLKYFKDFYLKVKARIWS